MKRSPTLAVRAVLLILVSGPLLSLLFIQSIPQGGNLWGESLNAGHAVLFGVIAAMLLWTLKASDRFIKGTLLRQYLTAGICIQVLGVSTEFIQPYFHRDCEVGDMIRDGLGIFIFLSAVAVFNHKLDGNDHKLSRKKRLVLLTATVLSLLGVFFPAGEWALAYLYRAHQFPVLVAYDSWLSRKFFVTPDAQLKPAEPPSDWVTDRPAQCALMTFFPARYSGLTVQEVEPDWRGFNSLAFDVFSVLDSTVVLNLGAYDRKHNYAASDRFVTTLAIKKGLNHIAIPLGTIKQAPKRRKMDLGSMLRVLVYSSSPRDSFSLYFSPIVLKH
jgi:hypothetical protein